MTDTRGTVEPPNAWIETLMSFAPVVLSDFEAPASGSDTCAKKSDTILREQETYTEVAEQAAPKHKD